jgi:hypothetical protein
MSAFIFLLKLALFESLLCRVKTECGFHTQKQKFVRVIEKFTLKSVKTILLGSNNLILLLNHAHEKM